MGAIPSERCNLCRFWKEDMVHRDPSDADWGFGLCRRRVPVLVSSAVMAIMPKPEFGQQVDPDIDTARLTSASLHPSTHSLDWCGEYERLGGGVPL